MEQRARKAAENSALVRALGLAHHWQQLMDSGKMSTLAEIADAEAMGKAEVSRILRLCLLAPNVIEAILDTTQPSGPALERLLRRNIPRDWEEQRRLFG